MKHKVYMIESERGWGQKVDEVKEFDTEDQAREFASAYNREHNPPGPTPDWYIMAVYEKDMRF